MEKEEKIAEMNRLADERTFYGMLRKYYDMFAVFWVSLLRVFAFFVMGVSTDACGFIFPIQCLTIVNLPLTAFCAFASQSAVGFFIYGTPY